MRIDIATSFKNRGNMAPLVELVLLKETLIQSEVAEPITSIRDASHTKAKPFWTR